MTAPDVGLSNINVVRDFSYTIASSSISYIRNYNFNTSTLTPIEVLLENKSQEIPITVDISASHPWLQIIEPDSNKNLVTPAGNVVLSPSSSKIINLNVDLPPEVEALSDTSLQISMSFYVRSGSYPIITSTPQDDEDDSDTNITPVFNFNKETLSVQPNNITTIDISLFQKGTQVFFEVEPIVEDETIAQIEPGATAPVSSLTHTVTIRGLREGQTRLLVLIPPTQKGPKPVVELSEAITSAVPIFVYNQAPTGTGGGGFNPAQPTGDELDRGFGGRPGGDSGRGVNVGGGTQVE